MKPGMEGKQGEGKEDSGKTAVETHSVGGRDSSLEGRGSEGGKGGAGGGGGGEGEAEP